MIYYGESKGLQENSTLTSEFVYAPYERLNARHSLVASNVCLCGCMQVIGSIHLFCLYLQLISIIFYECFNYKNYNLKSRY